MAPRRVLLLILVAAAAACPLLGSSPVLVAARDPPSGNHVTVLAAAAETNTGVEPPTATADADAGALNDVLAGADPAIHRTVYAYVTVVFRRATGRLGAPLLQSYVVPGDGSGAPVSGGGAGDSEDPRAGSILFVVGFFLGFFLGALSVFLTCKLDLKDGDEDVLAGDGGAIAKNPEVALAKAVNGAAKPRRGN